VFVLFKVKSSPVLRIMVSSSLRGLLAMTVFMTCDCRNLLNREYSMSDALHQSITQDQEYGFGYTFLMVAISAILAYGITIWFSKAASAATSTPEEQQLDHRLETSALVQKNTVLSQGEASPWMPCCVMLVSIPALVGSCCWPLLMASILGFYDIASAKYREAAHNISFGFHIGVFLVLLPQLFTRTQNQCSGIGQLHKWAPFCLATSGAALIMVDLCRHMILDQGYFEKHLAMYGKGGLTFAGKFGVVCTWLGVISLLIGTTCLTSFNSRIRKLFSSRTSEQAA